MTKADKGNLTPMMKQYLEIKKKHQDALLFYRLGDFYELFFEDAKVASKELDLALTHRAGNLMCGIPYHVADQYLERLLKKGFHVAICEQVEDPKEAKGIVKREVIKVITPGTIGEGEFLNKKENNYLLSIYEEEYGLYLAYLDFSTGECHFVKGHFLNQEEKNRFLFRHLDLIRPVEILGNSQFLEKEELRDQIFTRFQVPVNEAPKTAPKNLPEILKNQLLLLSKEGGGVKALESLFSYLEITQMDSLDHIGKILTEEEDRYLLMDESAKKNLELFTNLGTNTKSGSLFSVLDVNVTSMGSRKLRRWIDRPLRDLKEINYRQSVVEELLLDYIFLDDMRLQLEEVYDLERLSAKIAAESVNPKELSALKNSLIHVGSLKSLFLTKEEGFLKSFGKDLPLCEEVVNKIEETLLDDVPAVIGEQRIIKKGYDDTLDHLFAAREEGQQWILDLERREQEETGIKKLRVRYNKILGYYIEVPKSYTKEVPEKFVRKQTLVGSERYFTVELKEMESEILSSKENALLRQDEILKDLKAFVHSHLSEIQDTADRISTIDVLSSFAVVAMTYHYTKPTFNDEKKISIVEGRHPMVEANMKNMFFVPNDVEMNMGNSLISIITGPNMAGKSTYMRQTALILIMAHMGSFVPATSASLCILDRIFTRIGASDNLSAGDSTFMIEMKEVANIIREATADSLIILDEVGRGTGTLDGLSIAWALVEYLHDVLKVKTLFATHYHQLTKLGEIMDSVENLAILTEQTEEGITFLRKIVHGASNESFGIEVAELAGVGEPVILRAKEIFSHLEREEKTDKIEIPKEEPSSRQLSLEDLEKDQWLEMVASMDVNTMTPLEALNVLGEIIERSKKIGGFK